MSDDEPLPETVPVEFAAGVHVHISLAGNRDSVPSDLRQLLDDLARKLHEIELESTGRGGNIPAIKVCVAMLAVEDNPTCLPNVGYDIGFPIEPIQS